MQGEQGFEMSQLYLVECVPQPSTLPKNPTLYIIMNLDISGDISGELLYEPKLKSKGEQGI